MLNEVNYKEFLEQLNATAPVFLKRETDNGNQYLEYSGIATITDGVLDTIGLSQHVLAGEYNWSTNIMAHFNEYDNSISVNKWFYDPETGRKETGEVDRFVPTPELKEELARIMQEKEKEACEETAQQYIDFLNKEITSFYEGPEDTKAGLLEYVPVYAKTIAELQTTGDLANLSLSEKKSIADNINEFVQTCAEGGVDIINVHDARQLYQNSIKRESQIAPKKTEQDSPAALETLRADINKSIQRLDELKLSPGIQEQGLKMKEEITKVQSERT